MHEDLDLDLAERFRPLADATFVAPTSPGDLRVRRASGRRHTRLFPRRALGLAAAAIALVVGGTWINNDPATDPPGHGNLATGTPSTAIQAPAPTAPLGGTRPRLVLGSIPDGFATQPCSLQSAVVICTTVIPATVVPDGITVAWRQVPLAAGVEDAWAARDAVAAARLLDLPAGPSAFTELAGRQALTFGEVGRISGDEFDQPDRVARLDVFVVEGHAVQVSSEGVTPSQLEEVVGSIGFTPSPIGFSIPTHALPEEAVLIAEGRRRPWWLGDPLKPDLSTPYPGSTTGATFQVGEGTEPVDIELVQGVDPPAFLDQWSDRFIGDDQGRTEETFTDEGRSGRRITVTRPDGSVEGTTIALHIGDDAVVLVTGPGRLTPTVEAIAGSVVLDDAATSPAPTTRPPTETTITVVDPALECAPVHRPEAGSGAVPTAGGGDRLRAPITWEGQFQLVPPADDSVPAVAAAEAEQLVDKTGTITKLALLTQDNNPGRPDRLVWATFKAQTRTGWPSGGPSPLGVTPTPNPTAGDCAKSVSFADANTGRPIAIYTS